MIFKLYSRVAVKLGDERYEFDQKSLMFTEMVAIEDASGLSFAEWGEELGRYSIRAVAALLHVLRKRAGVPSDFQTLNFPVADLDVIPLKDDGTEMTAQEVADDLVRRAEEAAGPTRAAASAAGGDGTAATTVSTSPSSPNGSASAPGSGKSSQRATSSSSKTK